MKKITLISALIFVILMQGNFTFSQQSGFFTEKHIHDEQCIPKSEYSLTGNPTSTPDNYPSFIWPFQAQDYSKLFIANYIDHQSGTGLDDYTCGPQTYEGHRGTDIILNNFKEMDKQVYVVAAANGLVLEHRFNQYDRRTSTGQGNPSNYILIRHDDGTRAYYYHFMKNSVMVKVGEYVTAGTRLAYIGSSGNSTDAHLHFEPGTETLNGWSHKDPWSGNCNLISSLWQNQRPYEGGGFKVLDADVYINDCLGGSGIIPTSLQFKERVPHPRYVSTSETKIGIWVQLHGVTGSNFVVELRRPNNTLFKYSSYTLTEHNTYGWYYFTYDFASENPTTGTWYMRVIHNNVEQKRSEFIVTGINSYVHPRYKVAGRCYRRGIISQRDTLRIDKYNGSNLQWELSSNAPSYVSLSNDSLLNISGAAAWNQAARLRFFNVYLKSEGVIRDTFSVTLVDTTKPHPGAVSGIHNLSGNIPSEYKLEQNYPNPFNPETNIKFNIPKAGLVKIKVYDILGKEIATLVNSQLSAGQYLADFDGSKLTSGVYFYKLETEGFTEIKKMMLVK